MPIRRRRVGDGNTHLHTSKAASEGGVVKKWYKWGLIPVSFPRVPLPSHPLPSCLLGNITVSTENVDYDLLFHLVLSLSGLSLFWKPVKGAFCRSLSHYTKGQCPVSGIQLVTPRFSPWHRKWWSMRMRKMEPLWVFWGLFVVIEKLFKAKHQIQDGPVGVCGSVSVLFILYAHLLTSAYVLHTLAYTCPHVRLCRGEWASR